MCLSNICLLAMHTLICVLFLFLLVSGVGCDFCLRLFLDFSVYLFAEYELHQGKVMFIKDVGKVNSPFGKCPGRERVKDETAVVLFCPEEEG